MKTNCRKLIRHRRVQLISLCFCVTEFPFVWSKSGVLQMQLQVQRRRISGGLCLQNKRICVKPSKMSTCAILCVLKVFQCLWLLLFSSVLLCLLSYTCINKAFLDKSIDSAASSICSHGATRNCQWKHVKGMFGCDHVIVLCYTCNHANLWCQRFNLICLISMVLLANTQSTPKQYQVQLWIFNNISPDFQPITHTRCLLEQDTPGHLLWMLTGMG